MPVFCFWQMGSVNYGNRKGIRLPIQRKEEEGMKVIFEEYSGIIITAVAILALIAVATLLLAANGPVHTAFMNLIDTLFNQAQVP